MKVSRRVTACIGTAVLGTGLMLTAVLPSAPAHRSLIPSAHLVSQKTHYIGQGFTPSHLGALTPAEAQSLTGTVTVSPSGVTCSNAGAINGWVSSALFAQTQAGRWNGAAVYAESSNPTNFCVYHVNGLTELVQYGTSYCLSYQNSNPNILLGWACQGNAQWQSWTIDYLSCHPDTPCIFALDNNYSGTDFTFWNLNGPVLMESWDWLGGASSNNQLLQGL